MTTQKKGYLREPKQSRSRASLERLLKAAAELLAQRGYNEFTLQEVSKKAQVSIGSIYNRFNGKENLIRQIQENELNAMEIESAVIINQIRRKNLKLRELVPEVILQYANLLDSYKGIMRPLMEISATDEVVAAHGKQHAAQNISDFIHLLLERKDEIRQPDPQSAVEHSFRYIYASLARFLGLGITDTASGEGDWEEMLKSLGDITLHYLLGHPDDLKEKPSSSS